MTLILLKKFVRALPSILTVIYKSFLRLPVFRQTPNFVLYSPLLRTISYFTFKIFFVCGWFVLQGIKKRWLGRSQRKKRGWTAQFSHLLDFSFMLCHPCNCLQQTTHTSLSLLTFMKIWQTFCRLLCFRPSVN